MTSPTAPLAPTTATLFTATPLLLTDSRTRKTTLCAFIIRAARKACQGRSSSLVRPRPGGRAPSTYGRISVGASRDLTHAATRGCETWTATTNRETGPRFCPTCGRDVARQTRRSAPRAAGASRIKATARSVRGSCARRSGRTAPSTRSRSKRGPEPSGDGFDPSARWVTVGTFGDDLQAEAPRIRLEAEGIPTFVQGARMGSPSMYPVATGGVRLQVPDTLLADARVVLSQDWSPVVAHPRR